MKVLRVIYPDFSRVLTSSHHNIVIWKLSVWAVRTGCTKGWKLAETPGSKGGDQWLHVWWSPLSRGSPKGSVLRSALFNVFIDNFDGGTVICVDDTQLFGLTGQRAKLQSRGSLIHLRSGPTDTSRGSRRKPANCAHQAERPRASATGWEAPH